MKVRYGDKFDVNININNEIEGLYILRLVIQPVLENAILHGVNELEYKGVIDIEGYIKNNILTFEVKDNGIGMTDEQLTMLLSEEYRESRGFSSIGVKNVDKRIKLNHGNNFGLAIQSNYGEYTNVVITLPIKTENIDDIREEEEYV
jgi:two-component system, sensor histidine kinase YesM